MSLLGGLLLSSIKVDPVLDICKKVTVHHSFYVFFVFVFFFEYLSLQMWEAFMHL